MKIITEPCPLDVLWKTRTVDFSDMMKIVVDVERNILAVDADMHADLEELLLSNGSRQKDLWGANIYPGEDQEDFLEYTSFINIRPADGNRSMEVQDPEIRARIVKIVNHLIIH